MKIVHIGQMIGGLGTYIRNIISYTDDSCIFVIISGINDGNMPVQKNGIEIPEYKVKLERKLNLVNDIRCLLEVVKILRREKPDIIHCHSAKGGFVGRIAGFFLQIKTVYTPHAFSFLSGRNFVEMAVFIFLEKVSRLNSYLLACSNSEKEVGIKKVGYKNEKALVWINSVPDSSLSVCNTFEQNNQAYICSVGRPSLQKNSLFLIEVAQEIISRRPDIHFYILGVGHYSPYQDKVQKLIEMKGLENNIKLIPWLSQRETYQCIKNSLLYISVSLYEGLPLSVIEALSLGKPVIASKVIGNEDCVRDNYNGYLLRLDKNLFYQKVVETISDISKLEKLGNNSRMLFLKEFDITKNISRLQQIYSQVGG
jgi:glycosyltransferase involved in cell wall biosynthesis